MVYTIGPSLPQGDFDVFDNSRFKLLSNPDLTVDENVCLNKRKREKYLIHIADMSVYYYSVKLNVVSEMLYVYFKQLFLLLKNNVSSRKMNLSENLSPSHSVMTYKNKVKYRMKSDVQ